MNGKTGVRSVGLVGSWHQFCRALKGGDCNIQVVGVHGHVPHAHCGEVAKTGSWLVHGCTLCGSSGRASAHALKAWGNKGCIVWKRQPLAGGLALKRLASKLESCPQPSPLSVRKFYRSWKPAMSFSFHRAQPLYAAAHMHCPHPSCFGSAAQH